MSTSRRLAMFVRCSSDGCTLLVHHFDTVAGSLPICSLSHLAVRFFSTRTTLMRLMSAMLMQLIDGIHKDIEKLRDIKCKRGQIRQRALSFFDFVLDDCTKTRKRPPISRRPKVTTTSYTLQPESSELHLIRWPV